MPKKVININDLSNGIISDYDEKDTQKSVADSKNLMFEKGKIIPVQIFDKTLDKGTNLNVWLKTDGLFSGGYGLFCFVTDYDMDANENASEYIVIQGNDKILILDRNEQSTDEIDIEGDEYTYFYAKGFLRIVNKDFIPELNRIWGRVDNVHIGEFEIDGGYKKVYKETGLISNKNDLVSCISPRGLKSGDNDNNKPYVILHGIKFQTKFSGNLYSDYYIRIDYMNDKPGSYNVYLEGKTIVVHIIDGASQVYNSVLYSGTSAPSFIEWWNNTANIEQFVKDNFEPKVVKNTDLDVSSGVLTDAHLAGIRGYSGDTYIHYAEDTDGDGLIDNVYSFVDSDLYSELYIKETSAKKFPETPLNIKYIDEITANDLNIDFRFQFYIPSPEEWVLYSEIGDLYYNNESNTVEFTAGHYNAAILNVNSGIPISNASTSLAPNTINITNAQVPVSTGGDIYISFTNHNGDSEQYVINVNNLESASSVKEKIFNGFNNLTNSSDFTILYFPKANHFAINIYSNQAGNYNGATLSIDQGYSYIEPRSSPNNTITTEGGSDGIEPLVDYFIIDEIHYVVSLQTGYTRTEVLYAIFNQLNDLQSDYTLVKDDANFTITSADNSFNIGVIETSDASYSVENPPASTANGNLYILPYNGSVVIDIEKVPIEENDLSDWDNDTYSFGLSYVFLDDSESNINRSHFKTDITENFDIKVGIRLSNYVGYNKFAKGIKVYCIGDNSDDWIFVGYCDLNRGFKPHNSDIYNEFVKLKNHIDNKNAKDKDNGYPISQNEVVYTEPVLIKPNFVKTFEYETGYSLNDNIHAQFKRGIVVNNRLFAFNIFYEKEGEKYFYPDRILISPVNKLDILPESNYIDIVTEDGDEYISATSFGNEILAFKSNFLYIVDVSSNDPSTFYLKKDYKGAGIYSENAFCKTPYGVFWVNKQGLFLYDGKSPINLCINRIQEEFVDYINTSGSVSVGYDNISQKVIVIMKRSSFTKSYIFDIKTKGFSKHSEAFFGNNLSNFSYIYGELLIATNDNAD